MFKLKQCYCLRATIYNFTSGHVVILDTEASQACFRLLHDDDDDDVLCRKFTDSH